MKVTFKFCEGKYIVTVKGNECVFDSYEDAFNYIFIRRFIKF